MTDHRPDGSPRAESVAHIEEEVNLGEYVLVLINRKWLILGLAVFVAVLVFVVSSASPKKYESTASVAMHRLRSEITFAPTFRTISEGDDSTGGSPPGRNKGLVALVTSGTVAKAVLKEVGPSLGEEDLTPAGMAAMVEAETEGDIIQITASYKDPEKAALIANSFARQYEKHVNEVYSVGGAAAPLESTIREFDQAKTRYQKAQELLTNFLAKSEVAARRREIGRKKSAIGTLDESVRKELDRVSEVLMDHYSEHRRLRNLHGDVKLFQEQVTASDEELSHDTLVLLMLKQKVFAGRVTDTDLQEGRFMPVANWQLSTVELSGVPRESLRKDVGSLVKVIEGQIAQLDGAISAMTEDFAQGKRIGVAQDKSTDHVAEMDLLSNRLDREIRALQARVDTEQALQKELIRVRDQALQTYETIARKVDELHLAAQIKSSEVRIVSEAIVPVSPVSPKPKRNATLGGVVGLMLGCFLAFFLEFMKGVKQKQEEVTAIAGSGTP